MLSSGWGFRIIEGSISVQDDGLSYYFFGRPALDSLTILIADCGPLYTKLFHDHMNNNVF